MSITFKEIEIAVKNLPAGNVRIILMEGGLVLSMVQFNKVEMTLKSGNLSKNVYNYIANNLSQSDAFKVEIVPARSRY